MCILLVIKTKVCAVGAETLNIIICIETLEKNLHTISYQDKSVRSGSRNIKYYVFRKFLAFCVKLW